MFNVVIYMVNFKSTILFVLFVLFFFLFSSYILLGQYNIF